MRILKWIRVTLTLQTDENHKSIRAATLAVFFAIVSTLPSSISAFRPIQFLARNPFELDLALRAVSLGWFGLHNTVPISMVEIGESTYRTWGSPAVTPRAALIQMLDTVTRSNPAAVVVDIDLSFDNGSDLAALGNFLRDYDRSAPLIFPKRLEPGAGNTRRMAASPLDAIFAVNSHLSWAHATFEAGKGGAVRRWADWLEVCTDNETKLLPSVVVQLAAMLADLPPGLKRPKPPPRRNSCQPEGDAPGRLLLIGPRLTDPIRHAVLSDAQWVAASALLEPGVDRDDVALFEHRVVFIGAVHSGSRDFWLTPSGLLPGVELLANTVRFAPLTANTGSMSPVLWRITAAFALAVFAALTWCFRPLMAVAAAIVFALGFSWLLVEMCNCFWVFESIEASLLLFLWYKAIEVILDFLADWKTHRYSCSRSFLTVEFLRWREARKKDVGSDPTG